MILLFFFREFKGKLVKLKFLGSSIYGNEIEEKF